MIEKFFEKFSQGTGKYVFGVDDTLNALEIGVVGPLSEWESQYIDMYKLRSNVTGEIIIKLLSKEQEANDTHFSDLVTSIELEILEKLSLLKWFVNEYCKFGFSLEFLTIKSHECSKFYRVFGGIGGMLCYHLDMRSFDDFSDDG